MTSSTYSPDARSPYAAHRPGFLARSEAWLDARGKGAWIAAMVLGFIFVWPVGLAILAYMIWSNRMFNKSCAGMTRHNGHFARHAMTSSGNAAFDAYKSDTLRRLEEEQTNFEAFLTRLREAKDKAEFDQFMADRSRKTEDRDNRNDRDTRDDRDDRNSDA